MPPFKEWKYKDASEAVTAAIKASVGDAGFKSNQAFVEDHDHWQAGNTWVGPDGGLNSPVKATILAAVERQFTPVDVIGEVLDNVANALLSREAAVSFAALEPAEPDSPAAFSQREESDLMLSAISRWWDNQRLWEKARKATKRARWASRGALRNWIAPTTLVRSVPDGPPTLPTTLEFVDALGKVLISAPAPDNCFVETDDNTNDRAAVYLYKRGEKSFAEIWYVDGEDTVVSVVEGAGEPTTYPPYKLGRRLPIAEMKTEVLITEPVRRQQNRLNFFESLLVRVGETAGFPERYTLNAKPQGVWLKTAPQTGPALETHTEDGGSTWYLHATPRTLGAAITTDLRGLTTRDSAGNESIASPGVVFKEPTNPEYAIRAGKHARHTILRDCKQGHLATDSTAESSGIAYVQARAAFEADLNNTRSPLEGMLRETIESAIAMAELMSGVSPERSFLTRFRCVVNLHVNAGPITPEEKTSNALMVEKRLLSRDSAMAANGIEDVAAEIEAIDSDPGATLSEAKARGEAIKSLTDAGASVEQAAKMIGMSEEDAKAFGSSSFTEPVVEQ